MANKEDLSQLTVKVLREMLVKLGMPEDDANNFETKKPLISTINTLRAQKVVEAQSKGQLKVEKKEYLSKKERMRAILMAQSTVRVKIPCEGSEKPGVIKWVYNKTTKRKEQVYVSGAYLPVQLNGFKWLVAKGVYQEVPQQVADTIDESDTATTQAGKPFLIDRDDIDDEGNVKGKVSDKL